MEIMPSCNTSTLSAYVPSDSNPWDVQKVQHVFRRLGFGSTKADINQALTQTPTDFIDAIIDGAIAAPLFPEPSWANWSYNYYINNGLDFDEETQNNHQEIRLDAINDFFDNSFRGKMVLFWSNHFVTELNQYYCSNLLYKYYNMLQRNVLGNFQDFVREVGLNEAMLLYLNGFENGLYGLNENYSRELYELFTLGENNGYTQSDIVETAKALTGYNHWTDDWCSSIYFIEPGNPGSTFINEDKTIFGQTGNWGYDDVIDILFQEKAPLIAGFICEKLYTYFVSPNVSEDIVAEMTTAFQVDWNIENLLRTLFKSEHFFDEKSVGALVKSPYELLVQYISIGNFTIDDEQKMILHYFTDNIGQRFLDPPNVAGWQGDESWINSSTLTGRWQVIQHYIWYTWGYQSDEGSEVYDNREELRNLAIDSSNNSNDPYVVSRSIIDRFVPKELHTLTDYTDAGDVFKANIPQNYYDDGLWDLYWDQVPYQVVLLLLHLAKMPELQIN